MVNSMGEGGQNRHKAWVEVLKIPEAFGLSDVSS